MPARTCFERRRRLMDDWAAYLNGAHCPLHPPVAEQRGEKSPTTQHLDPI